MLAKLTNRIPPVLQHILRITILVLLLAPVLIAVARQWTQVRETLGHLDWVHAGPGLALLIAAQPLMGLISWMILRGLGQFFPYLRITALYFISQAAKYLPGGIWAFPGRVVAYQAIGVEKLAAFISLVQEVGALFLGSASLGFLGLLIGLRIPEWTCLIIGLGIGACVLAILVAQLPATFKLAARFGLVRAELAQALAEQGYRLKTSQLPAGFAASLLFWLMVGFGFHQLTLSISPNAATLSGLQAASLFSLAWCAGFVVVVAPAGLGVREATLTGLLSPYMTSAEALSIALLARLWWTLGEAGFIGLALLWMSGKNYFKATGMR